MDAILGNHMIQPSGPVTNGHIYYICKKKSGIGHLLSQFNVSNGRVYRMVNKVQKLMRNLSKNKQLIIDYLNEPLICKGVSLPKSDVEPSTSYVSELDSGSSFRELIPTTCF